MDVDRVTIENRHIVRLKGADNKITGTVGEPLYFNLGQSQIEDLNQFCDAVFSGEQPFCLWGVPQEIDDGLLVHAVDLQTGSKMNFQIYKEVISLSLEPKACGNSVVRFFSNIQQIFSHLITAEDGDGNNISRTLKTLL